MTEKPKPHHSLAEVKHLAKEGQCKLLISALQTAHKIGFSETEAIEVIAELRSGDFYKSMTEYNNYKVWQDVYKTRAKNVNIYIKLKIVTLDDRKVLVPSFKEDTGLEGERK